MREPHGLLGETRVAHDLRVICPAGAAIAETIRGAGCQCRVTDTEVASATDPSSLQAFCLNPDGYRECPVWRADKEAWWAGRENAVDARRAAPRAPQEHPALQAFM